MKNSLWLNPDVKTRRNNMSLIAFCRRVIKGSAMLLLASLCLAVISCAAEKTTDTANPAIRANQLDPPPPTYRTAAVVVKQSGSMPGRPPQRPLSAGVKAASLHSPFADGNCILCHMKQDPNAPGPLLKPVNEICLDCHGDFKEFLNAKFTHGPTLGSCVNCHNPHNSIYPMLLEENISTLCLGCHSDMKAKTTEAHVKHDATIKDKACINCHNPHGANVEHLLVDLPFNLCVTCHGEDDVIDNEGNRLTNFKELLAENKEQHGPVKNKDCSACHNPHGGKYFRLLDKEYPAEFYSPYDPQLYSLCFECHENRVFEEPQTETLTLFRNGTRNLHYLHVNKTERGRTCRACHEVHASQQAHHIREGVPYGSTGWVLKIRYSPTPSGGTCVKNCHDTKSYNNLTAVSEAKK